MINKPRNGDWWECRLRTLGRKRLIAGAGVIAAGAAALIVLGGASSASGTASQSSVTVALPSPTPAVAISEARVPGRPIVLIDPGHGGQDPGATAVSGDITEKQLTLGFARELRDKLVTDGRVRVALTRDGDRYLSLAERAALARRIGASLYLSIHMDSAPNPLARGATVYSLSEVASGAEAAQMAARSNASMGPSAGEEGTVQAILSDLALRSQMRASADFAQRLVRSAQGRVTLRPQPHQFADFAVLREAGTPAVLFEAGYISNKDDEAALRSPEQRARIIAALAQSIETDIAARSIR
jgi:N-acetylmuramoyl-L-alanine amidase